MPIINRFPGRCAECSNYVAAGAGVYVEATVRAYCATHAPDDLFNRLAGDARKGSLMDLHRQGRVVRSRYPFAS